MFPIRYGQVTKEIYYIPLSPHYLEAHRKSGISIRLKGANGTLAATEPATFVEGFLTSLDATQRN
jgi:hypothetical protein